MQLAMYQVDAFTGRLFAGNPAAVCPLEAWLPDATMQAIAAENNLSETAFFVPRGDDYDLRRSGALTVTRQGEMFAIDLPAQPPTPCAMPQKFVVALGREPAEILGAVKYLALYDTEAEVAALAPDTTALADIDRDGVIVSAPGRDCDFVSRYFAPHAGIPEDPVTDSAHCTLVPYWSKRLGKAKLHARQISQRGGELFCELRGDRVVIAGRAALYFEGSIHV